MGPGERSAAGEARAALVGISPERCGHQGSGVFSGGIRRTTSVSGVHLSRERRYEGQRKEQERQQC